MIIYGCEGEMEIEKEPFNCIMGSSRCGDMLAAWTVGDEGEICNCFLKEDLFVAPVLVDS